MKQAWRVTIWGVRGSIPMVSPEYMGYGGNTSCVCLDCGGDTVVLDAGSGLTALGARMAREGRRRADILLGHIHLDHVLGLFSFPLLHEPEAQIHLYADSSQLEALVRLTAPPLWPVSLADYPARVSLHPVTFGCPFSLAGWKVTPFSGNHPGSCLYYGLERNGRRLVYALDCEAESGYIPHLIHFVYGADLLIWDAAFAPEDLKPGWGHATWRQGLDLAREAGVKHILMTHYAPQYTDVRLREQEQRAIQASRGWSGGRCTFAREGLEVFV